LHVYKPTAKGSSKRQEQSHWHSHNFRPWLSPISGASFIIASRTEVFFPFFRCSSSCSAFSFNSCAMLSARCAHFLLIVLFMMAHRAVYTHLLQKLSSQGNSMSHSPIHLKFHIVVITASCKWQLLLTLSLSFPFSPSPFPSPSLSLSLFPAAFKIKRRLFLCITCLLLTL